MDTALASPMMKSLLAGMFSGTCSTLLFQPLDLVKTRIQTSVTGSKSGMVAAFANVIEHDRVVGLWRGLVPSITRCVPGVGIYFCSLHWLRTNFGSMDPHPLESICMGATARTFAGTTVLPFTVVKTRFESGTFQYKSMRNALFAIGQKEGIRGLFCGLGPTLLRDVPFSGLYLMFYTQLKKKIPQEMYVESYIPCIHFLCGITAGTFASLVTQPADVVKTRIQLYPERYRHVHLAIFQIYQSDGLPGFWRGIVPRTLRRTLMAALAWTVYEQIMRRCGLTT